MAQVWAARQQGLHGFEKLVAMKIIHSRFAEAPQFRTMLLDEARIVGRLHHRNIVDTVDVFEDSGQLYLVMDYVHGPPLGKLVALLGQRGGTIPIPIAVALTIDLLEGLHAAHEARLEDGAPLGIVHRDVSPHNVLIGADGTARVMDFGIATAAGRIYRTEPGQVKGKVAYMAPEQARGHSVDRRADVYSAGIVLFELLTMQRPFLGDTFSELASQQVFSPPPSPRERRPEVDDELAKTVLRALEKAPEDRYPTARAMAEALENVAKHASAGKISEWVRAEFGDFFLDRERLLRPVVSNLAASLLPPTALVPLLPSPPPLAFDEPSPASVTASAILSNDDLDASSRGFIDVHALVAAQANAPRPAPAPAPNANAETQPGQSPPAPRHAPATTKRPGTGWAMKLAILTIGLVFAAVLLLLLVPRLLRDHVVAKARESGIQLTVERFGVGFGGLSLRGVTATTPRIPGLQATMQEVHVEGIAARSIRVHGLDLRLRGSREDLEQGLASLLADHRARFAGTASAPRALSLVGARLTWEGIRGEGTRLEAGEIGVDVESRGAGLEDVRSTVGRFSLASPTTTVGPWSSAIEHGPLTSRVRVMFDPPVPDGPSAILVWGRAVPTEATVRIPRSSFQHLGIRPSDFGLPTSDATEVELLVEARQAGNAPLSVKATGTLWGARIKGFPSAVDIRVDGGASGPKGRPLDLEKVLVSVGPFTAGVTGTVTPHDDGARLDAMFRTVPMTCERLARAEAKNMGALAQTLQAFGQTTGLLRVTGTVNASGIVKYDTAKPEDASVSWLAKETCGLSIFGL